MRMVGPAADRRVPRLHTRVVTKTPRSGNVVEATGAGEAGSARGADGAGAPARTVGQAFERVLRWVDELRDDREAIHAAITEGGQTTRSVWSSDTSAGPGRPSQPPEPH